MRNHKYILTIAFVGAFSVAFAAGLPSNGLQAHFRADHVGRVVNNLGVVPTHGSAVSCWTTEPGVESPLKLVKDGDVTLPNWQTNAFRRADGTYLPAVRFRRNADNSEDIASMHLVSSKATTLNLGKDSTWFLVMNNLAANPNRGVFGFNQDSNANLRFGAFFLKDLDNMLRVHNNANPGANGNMDLPIGQSNLIDSRGGSDWMTAGLNGLETLNFSQTTCALNAKNFYLGRMVGVDSSAAFDCAELAIYNRALNDAEVRIVRNSLAARWGLAIDNLVWTGASAGFCNDLAGIGSSTATGNGRIPGVVNTSASAGGLVLSVSSGSIDGADGYLLVAHDGKPAKMSWSEADGFLRVTRTWRTETTLSSVPAVTFAFDLAELGVGSATVRLLYRANSSSAFADIGISGALVGNVCSFSFVAGAYKDGEYTLAVDAVADAGTALPSTDDLAVWFKPETGLVASGNDVVTWENQGFLSHEVDVHAYSGTVKVVENALENSAGTVKYPALDFGGSSFLRTSVVTDLGRDVFAPPSWFVVFKPSETSDLMKNAAIFGYESSSIRFGVFFPSAGGGYMMRPFLGEGSITPVDSPAISKTDWHIADMSAFYSSTNSRYEVSFNVDAANKFARSMMQVVTSDYFRVGCMMDIDWCKPFPGQIAEIRVYKRPLNPAERLVVEMELADKYGLSLANEFLGVTHASGLHYGAGIAAVGYEDVGRCGYSAPSSGGLSVELLDWTPGAGTVYLAHNGQGMSWTAAEGLSTLSRSWYFRSSSTLPSMRLDFMLGCVDAGVGYEVCYRTDDNNTWVRLPYSAAVANGTVSVKIPAGLATGYFTLCKIGSGDQVVLPCAAVDDGLAGWYRADTGVSVEDGAVSVWRNLGLLGTTADVTKAAGTGSATQTTGVFSEYGINFDGSALLKTASDVSFAPSNDNTWFVVFKVADGVTPMNMGVVGSRDATIRFGAFFTGSSDLRTHGYVQSDTNKYCVVGRSNMDFAKVMLVDSSRTGNVVDTYLDGSRQQCKSNTLDNANASAFMIGQMAALSSKFNGDIAEVRVYNRALSDAERNIVANHLAARYGITMAGNSLYGGAAAGCTLDVVGIGCTTSSVSSASGVHVAGSITVSDNSAGLAIAASCSLSDGDYVLAGHGEKDNRWVRAGQGVKRMKRAWHITKTNASSLDLMLEFNLDNAGVDVIDAKLRAAYKLVRSLDGGLTWQTVAVDVAKSANVCSCALPATTFAEGLYTIGADVVEPGTVVIIR